MTNTVLREQADYLKKAMAHAERGSVAFALLAQRWERLEAALRSLRANLQRT